MRGKIKSQVKVIMLFCIGLMLSDCQTEEHSSDQSQSTIQTVSIDDAKNFLAQSKSNSVGKSTNSQLENLEFDKIAQEKIKGSNQLLTVIPFATNSVFENKRILLLKIDNEIRTIVFSMYPDEDAVKGSFSGKIFSHTLDGSFITGFRAENGIIVSQFIESNDSTEKNNTETGKISTRRVQLKEVVVQNNYRNTVHALDMFGSTGMYGDGLFGGGIGNSGGGGYSWDAGGGISAPTPIQITIALEKQIDGSQLDPCPKSILEKLKNATNCDITNVFTKLKVGNVYTVTIISGDAGNKPANTVRNDKNKYTTILNNQAYTSSTQLYKAANILHELTHAFFLSLVDDYYGSGNPAVFSEFPILFQAYVDTKYPKNTENGQHEEMANAYVEAIGAALQEFQTGVSLSNGTKADQIYTDLAWGGLRDAPIFGKIFPLGSAERLRIENRLAAEQTGNIIGAGTAQQQNPIGNPCN